MRYVVEHFNSIEHLLKSNEMRKLNKVYADKDKLSSEKPDSDWSKTPSYAAAVELIRNGYTDPLEKIKRGIAASTNGLTQQKTAVKTDVVGYAPCVPNAILGVPQSMINKDTAVKKSKIITIVYDTAENAGTNAETFIKAGITVLTIINALEASGYRVALKNAFYNASEDRQNVFATISLKDWRQPLDLKKMAFPFCHPSMLRRIGFKWLETQPELTDSGYRYTYGRANVSEDTLRANKLIADNEKFINIEMCQKHDYDPKAVAKACGLNID